MQQGFDPEQITDFFEIGGKKLISRLFTGTGKFSSHELRNPVKNASFLHSPKPRSAPIFTPLSPASQARSGASNQ